MKNTHLLFLFLTLLFASCQEEKITPQVFGSLVGTVLSTEDNIAIAQATVSTNPPTSSLQTDELGRFTVEQIEAGTYTIRAEKEGFVTEIENVTVFANQDANVILRLIRESTVNSAPDKPQNPQPATGSVAASTDISFSWTGSDGNNDDLTYDVILCTSDEFTCDTIARDLTETEFDAPELQHSTVYFWQVRAKDGFTDTNGDLWSFETPAFPDNRFLCARKVNGKYDIYSSDAENTSNIKLTNSAGDSWRPRVNPQRTKIAYLSNLGIETHLYVMNLDGSEKTQVTQGVPVSGLSPLELDFTWSPNGAEILYPAGNELYRIGISGIGLTKVADAPEGQMFAEVDWTQIGNKIAVRTTGNNIYESDIFILDAAGNYLQQVYADIPGRETGPRFSLDGNRILYTHDITGYEAPDGRQLAAHIFEKSLTTNVAIDLSEESDILAGTNDLDADYSPDGAFLIFVNTNNDGISQENILRMEAAGDDRELLFGGAVMPEWF